MLLGGNSSNAKVTLELVSDSVFSVFVSIAVFVKVNQNAQVTGELVSSRVNCGNNVTAASCQHCPGYMISEYGNSYPAEGCGENWWRYPNPTRECPCSGDCQFSGTNQCHPKERTG